jgi:hypothetical protein
MESPANQLPLKVCRHCSVASRTDAESCPSCGKSYQRELWRWHWWLAIPIIVLAFGVGYGARKVLDDDSEPSAITLEQAGSVGPDTTQADLAERFGDPEGNIGRIGGAEGSDCVYYEVSDRAETAWVFCFKQDQLVVTRPIPVPAGG